MGKCKIWIVSVLMICLLVGCSSTKEGVAKSDPKRNEAWIEDIDYLTSQLSELHSNLFFNTTEEEYNKKIEELKKEVPKLTDTQINFRMKEIVASIGDAHTLYNVDKTEEEINNENIYHMMYTWFEDEIRIVGANEKYRDILGMKLVGINNIPIDEIVEKIGSIISYENKEWLKTNVLDILTYDDTLMYLGISKGGKVEYNLEDDKGKKLDKTINTLSMIDAKQQPIVRYVDTLENRAIPIAQDTIRKEYRPYWYKFVSEDNIFYLKYQQCYDQRDVPNYPKFDEFSKELIESLNKNIDNVDKLVVDVRYNKGGLNLLMKNLSSELRKTIGRSDIKTYVITDRGTFSSGVQAAADLNKDLNATIIGGETGGNLATYGNIDTIEAPNGKGYIVYSKNYYEASMYTDLNQEGPIIPDVKIKESFESYTKGIDDCYEYIKNAN